MKHVNVQRAGMKNDQRSEDKSDTRKNSVYSRAEKSDHGFPFGTHHILLPYTPVYFKETEIVR